MPDACYRINIKGLGKQHQYGHGSDQNCSPFSSASSRSCAWRPHRGYWYWNHLAFPGWWLGWGIRFYTVSASCSSIQTPPWSDHHPPSVKASLLVGSPAVVQKEMVNNKAIIIIIIIISSSSKLFFCESFLSSPRIFVLLLKNNFSIWIYFIPDVTAEFSASLLQSSVSYDPSEIIIICWFAAQETLSIENCCASYLCANHDALFFIIRWSSMKNSNYLK